MRIRTVSTQPELRDERRLVFYPAVFNTPARVSEFGEQFEEVILPGSFSRSLRAGSPVVANVSHDTAKNFARWPGALLLQEDERGLFASAYLAPGELNDAILADVKAGRITGGSVKFRDVAGGRTRTPATVAGGLPLDVVSDVDLMDVTLAYGDQVYRQTTVSVRTAQLDETFLRLRLLKARR